MILGVHILIAPSSLPERSVFRWQITSRGKEKEKECGIGVSENVRDGAACSIKGCTPRRARTSTFSHTNTVGFLDSYSPLRQPRISCYGLCETDGILATRAKWRHSPQKLLLGAVGFFTGIDREL